MEVTQAMTKNTPDAKAPDLPRFGMVMDLPYSMDKSQWYGRGPIENYSDRKLSERIGQYTDNILTVHEEYASYASWTFIYGNNVNDCIKKKYEKRVQRNNESIFSLNLLLKQSV